MKNVVPQLFMQPIYLMGLRTGLRILYVFLDMCIMDINDHLKMYNFMLRFMSPMGSYN